MTNAVDTIVIGGGAAGLMCASRAAKEGASVILLEHNKNLGRKILISGGGRCNFTNLYADPSDFQSSNPHFFKSALSRYTPYDFLDLVDSYGIKHFEKKDGQLFCQKSAHEIVQMLERECLKSNVDIRLGTTVKDVKLSNDLFEVELGNEVLNAKSLVVATGGLSISQIGASDFGHRLAKKFGHKIVPASPALVPLKMEGNSELSGISLPCRIGIDDKMVEDEILFTHKGFSGPAVLKISLYWEAGKEVLINFLPHFDLKSIWEKEQKISGGKKIQKLLKEYLPNKLVDYWLQELGIQSDKNLSEIGKDLKIELIEMVHHFKFVPSGTEGYRKAEVTRGGVSVDEISSKTMESKLISGLYFVGEVMDVTGSLGGFNFQWAWASGVAAGQAIAKRVK